MKTDFYPKLYLWLASRRRMVFFTVFVIAAICFAISSRISLEENILAVLPQNDPIVEDYKYTLQQFHELDRVYIDVGVTNSDPQKLTDAADAFYDALSANGMFARITYRIEMGSQQQIMGFLTGSLPNLFTTNDEQALAEKLDTASVRNYLTEKRQQLAGPEGMIMKDVVAADPIGMTGLVIQKIVPLQTGFGNAHVEDGRITSSDGKNILMVAEPNFPSGDSKKNAVLVNEMVNAAHAVEQKFPGVHVAITGGNRMAYDNARLIRRDGTRCMIIAISAMFILCFSAYRRRWLATVTFLPSLFGSVVAGAVVTFGNDHVSAIAVGFASMAIGITVDYGIYVVYHLDNAATDRSSAGKIVARLVLPTFIGAMTIIAAFIVLSTSPMQGYHQLGIFGAFGVIMSAAFALFVLPLIVPLPKTGNVQPLRFTGWMEGFHAWQKRYRPHLLVGVLVLTGVTAFGIRHLHFEGDIAKLNGATAATQADDKLINDVWGNALGTTLVVARGKTVDAALRQDDRAYDLLSAQTNVTDIYSLSSICPAPENQEENIARWQHFWTPQRKEHLHAALQQIGGELGFRTNAFAPFWKTADQTPPLITLDTFRGTMLESALQERVAISTNDVAISTMIKLADRSKAGELRSALPGFILIDSRNFADHIASLARGNLGHFAMWTAIAVGLIVYLSLEAIEVVLATLLPIAFGLFWTLGLMGLFGLPINVANCVFVIFVIGMGEDYSVFLATSKLDVWRGHPPRIDPTSASVMISACTTIFGFAVLSFAQHPVLFSMGTTVLLGMVSAFIATLVITPACVDVLLWRNPPRGAPRWWHFPAILWAGIYLAVSQSVVFGPVRWILKIIVPKKTDWIMRKISHAAMTVLVKTFPLGRIEYQNFSDETLARPAIVISNHQSAVDVLVAFIISPNLCMTVKKRVYDAPFLGFACKVLKHVVVEANESEKTLAECRQRLESGLSLHFFPEGTRSPDGFVQRFRRGAFELAIELKQDILPVVLCDTNTSMPRDAYWFEAGHATVRALPRVTPDNFDYSQGATALMRHCEKIVRDALQQQLDEINTPATVRRKVARLYRYQGKFVEQFVFWKMKADPVFPALDKVVPRGGFILDLGCGYGMATHWLSQFTDDRSFLGVDYDENKIRVAQRTAADNPRIRFEEGNLLEMDYPACDVVLLLDVLHYWLPEKQQDILNRARRALRPGGKLILRDGAKAEGAAHRNVYRWEVFATKFNWNRTREGLHFQTLDELTAALKKAGFENLEIHREAGRDSNVMIVAVAGKEN